MPFFETSALSRINVEEAFFELVRTMQIARKSVEAPVAASVEAAHCLLACRNRMRLEAVHELAAVPIDVVRLIASYVLRSGKNSRKAWRGAEEIRALRESIADKRQSIRDVEARLAELEETITRKLDKRKQKRVQTMRAPL